MATAYSETYTTPVSNRTVYINYILTNYNDITINSISSSVRNSNQFGVNGTYFIPGTTNLVGIAINNGAQVRNYGTMNRDPRVCTSMFKCGTMVCPKSSTTGIVLFTDVIDRIDNGWTYNGETFTMSNIKWAIGGTSLFPNDSLDETTYKNKISTEDPGGGVAGIAPRTAIIYTGGTLSSNMVLLSVQSSANDGSPDSGGFTFWELREYIRNKFKTPNGTPPVHAIALDGGGSTQIRYKDSAGAVKCYQVAGDRNVNSMVSTIM